MTASDTSNRSSSPDNSRSQGRGRSNSLPGHIVEYLKAWLMSPENINHPYPSEKEKARMVLETGIELKKLNNWFVNNRIRYWKPRMEALQKQQPSQPTKRSTPQQQQVESKTRSASTAATAAEAREKPVPSSSVEATTKDCPEVKCTVQGTSKLELPKPVHSLLHEVSDASVSTNDSSASDEDQEIGRDTHFSHSSSLTYDDVVEFNSPPRRVLKRPRWEEDESVLANIASPRTKYRQKNIETWKTACETSPKLHDTSLPSLDEAACLFGYSSISV